MRLLRLLPLLLLALLAAAPAARASGSGVDVVASGLDSPRHLAFGARGDLFVAEAGRGADVPASGPRAGDLCYAAGEGPACLGATGAVTEIPRWGHQHRIAAGLPSAANVPADGTLLNTNAIGPHGIAVLGADHVFITNGGPTEPLDAAGQRIERETLAAKVPAAALMGRVLYLGRHGRPLPVADIYGFERRVNPDAATGNPHIDSNAVGLAFGRHGLYVADAGGNAIDVVHPFGRVSNLAVFPNKLEPNPFGPGQIPMQAVPTSVVAGPDGFLYVSQLTGFPFPAGAANIYRVDPRTGAVTVFASGFTNLMDLAFGHDGTLYALSIDDDSLLGPGTDGAIFAVSRTGEKRRLALPAGTLTEPGGIAVGRDGLYVSNFGGSPGTGQVLRLRGRY
jgi:hypothetical protein